MIFFFFCILSTHGSLSVCGVYRQYINSTMATAVHCNSRHDILLHLTWCNLSKERCITKAPQHNMMYLQVLSEEGCSFSPGPLPSPLNLFKRFDGLCFCLSWARGILGLLPPFLALLFFNECHALVHVEIAAISADSHVFLFFVFFSGLLSWLRNNSG